MPVGSQATRKSGSRAYQSTSRLNSMAVGVDKSSDIVAAEYAATLLYPGGVTGVKIPDFSLYPTVTAHTENEATFTCSAAGDGGMLVRMSPGRGNGSVAGAGGSVQLQNPATTAGNAFTYNAALNVRTQPAAFAASYQMCRLVSASVEVDYIGNDNNNQGRLASAVLIREELNLSPTDFDSFAEVLTARDCQSNTVSTGIMCRYKPLDELSFNFCSLGDTFAYNEHFTVLIAVTGAANAAAFRYKIVANWECVTKSDQYDQPIGSMIDTSPSDPEAFNKVKSWLPGIPSMTNLSDKVIQQNEPGNARSAMAEASKSLGPGLMDDVRGVVMDSLAGGIKGFALGGPKGALAGAAGAGLGSIYSTISSKGSAGSNWSKGRRTANLKKVGTRKVTMRAAKPRWR